MADKTGVDYAHELDSWGFNVVPAPSGGKLPTIKWTPFQSERTTARLGTWFQGKRRNYFIITGSISRVAVLDCDTPAAEAWWRELLGSVMDRTTCVTTTKGHHYYFRLPEGLKIRSRSRHDDATGIHWDLRAEGGGVIAPPSLHESGRVYEWMRDPSHIVDAPEALLSAEKSQDGSDGGGARSMLAKLLSTPPEGEGGRNNWLTRVAGHYAKAHRDKKDLYEVECARANEMLTPPLADAEFTKTVESIWSSEQAKNDEAVSDPDETTGWLVSGGDCLMTVVREKHGDNWVTGLDVWADFDVRAIGVVEDDEANRTYDVEVMRRRQNDLRSALLPARILNRPDALAVWLGELGVGIMPPDHMSPRAGNSSERLRRYIESQDPPHFAVVDHLGWHENGFVCHEGVIRADGIHGFDRHKPDPKLRNWAPYRYGFGDDADARRVMREILTFHDETVCSVFGAWWAICLLKPQVHRVTSQFPFMALEAPSESGKTTGFFSLMLQLSGNTHGQVDPTRAALRDWMSAHQSGIVWVDDLSDTQHLMDLLRQATGEGSVAKKGEDRFTQESVRLVAPIVISGESLQLHHQKALADRAVSLDVPSPTARRSLRDPERLQWLDIVALRNQWPDLTKLAGNVVQMALQSAEIVDDIPKLVPVSGGRFGDKIAVVRAGARLLSEMVADPIHTQRVDAWCADQDNLGSENTLTLRILPAALSYGNWPTRPEKAEGRWPATPAFLYEGVAWFSPNLLAAWWSEMRHGRIEHRTETEEALAQQARALGLGGTRGESRRRFNLSGDGSAKVWYWRVDEELSRLIVDRSRGWTPRGVHEGVQRLELPISFDGWTP